MGLLGAGVGPLQAFAGRADHRQVQDPLQHVLLSITEGRLGASQLPKNVPSHTGIGHIAVPTRELSSHWRRRRPPAHFLCFPVAAQQAAAQEAEGQEVAQVRVSRPPFLWLSCAKPGWLLLPKEQRSHKMTPQIPLEH